MDDADIRAQLPQAYAEALALRDTGLDEDQIAERLSLPPAAVASMLRVAEAKLARARGLRLP